MRAERVSAALLLVAALLLFSLYSIATPLFEASDELWHYPLVRHLATTGSLPEQRRDQSDEDAPWRQEGSQPPFYYAVAALVSGPVDSSNWQEIRRINPHSDMGQPTRDGNANAILHTTAEQFPWTRATLAVHLARLVSVLFSTATVFFAYLVACELFPRIGGGDRTLNSNTGAASLPTDQGAFIRLGTMVFTAFIPMFAFISGSVNNDNAAAMFGTLGLWWALHTARRADLSIRAALIAGLITAAAALSKSSTLGLIGLLALSTLFAGFKHYTLRPGGSVLGLIARMARFILIVIAVTAILAGWWFIRNQQLYGDPLGWSAFLDVVGRRAPPASLAQLWSEREGFVWAYWGVFGTLNVIMPPLVYDVLNGAAVMASAGAVWAILRRKTGQEYPTPGQDQPLLIRHAALVISAAWVAITFAALVRWTSLTPASQGRLMFPCIAVIAAWFAFGLYHIHRTVLWVASAGLIVLAVSVPFAIIMSAYAQPAPTNVSPSHPLDITFGDGLDLIGYDLLTPSVEPGDEATVRLYWHARQPLPDNYSVFVHLINEDDVIVAQRDMYPGQGSLATSELSPGYRWTDHYAARVPHLTLAPQRLRWAVGLYDLQTGQRLTVTHGTDSEQGIVFGQAELVPFAQSPIALLNYDNGISLTSYDVQPRSAGPGTAMTVTLRWRTERKIGDDYTVSLQLLDDKANKVAQHDSTPVEGNAPTSSWIPGQVIIDPHILQINADASPGVYRLLLVLYSPKDFSRLGAYDESGQYINTEIEMIRLRIK
ncbi:MAG: hypothetical protein M1546_04010 [Chloroflexi bacterium]|nr:hypothetical protein [Chloroflexota bacterium]